MSFKVPEKYRILGSPADGNNGYFQITNGNRNFKVVASDGADWEHVSVSLPNRCPSWPEMCFIKDIFWDKEDCIIQYHPPESEYINCHPNCLHLWRPIGVEFPRPPKILVGV